MSGDSIVAAKQEYTQQLCDILTPTINEGFYSIWKKCKDDNKALKLFQEKLCSVPKWNQDIIDKEYTRVVDGTDCEWLDKLIEAVFLSNVKVLSTIRIGKVKNINITVPDTKNFIHKCYVESARKLWQDPHIIDDREDYMSYTEIKRNQKRLNITLSECIEKTVSKLIPIQNILESYLTDIGGNVSESDHEPEPERPQSPESVYTPPRPRTPEYTPPESESDESKANSDDVGTQTPPVNSNFNADDLFETELHSEKIEPDLDVLQGSTINEGVENYSYPGKTISIPNNKSEKPIVTDSVPETIQMAPVEDAPFFSDSE